jgi:hypothetical protein
MENENLIKKILTTEVKYAIGIVVFVFGVVTPYYQVKEDISLIQKDISIINTNHEVHIQDMIAEIKKIKEDEVTIEKNLAITNQVLIDHLNLK